MREHTEGTSPSRPSVTLADTIERAGPLVEQGSAFMQLEGERLRGRRGNDGGKAGHVSRENFDVVVIGAGQAGLSAGYHLSRLGLNFVILDAAERIGDVWRQRWDSLRLFTAARFCGLAGMRFPASQGYFPTKDEMADFLESYARHFRLPVRLRTRVNELVRDGAGGYLVRTDASEIHADQVVIAASSYQKPKLPAFAGDLDPGIRQLHSLQYRNPGELADGSVLMVGAGNSGAEIGSELAASREVLLAGNHPGEIPVQYDTWLSIRVVMPIVFRLVFHRLLSVDTSMGRKAKPRFLFHSGPLIRVKSQHLDAKGVKRVGRIAGVREGRPLTEDGTVLDVANVIWCTGFKPGFDWIKLPIFDETGRPKQYRGVAERAPGLFFVGLSFQHSASSTMIHGVARDARWVAQAISRQRAGAGAVAVAV